MLSGTRLEVWGDPIDHSLSPRLHGAAYAVLGLEWTYGRRRVAEADFATEIAGLDASWRGLSLTMPLKHVAAAGARTLGRHTRLTGAANTYVLDSAGAKAFNTDVVGLMRALTEHGLGDVASARILGAGATAASALVALNDLGVHRVEVRARTPESATALRTLARDLDVRLDLTALDEPAVTAVGVTIATLPGGTELGATAERLAEGGGALFDVVYGGWPTPLARTWERHGHEAHSGLGMLVNQALLQVRAFVAGDPGAHLDDEASVLAAMRAAVMGD
jgi:shikimate dehydrogenase